MDDLSRVSERIQWSPETEDDHSPAEPMRGNTPGIRRAPSTDQRKIRSQMRRSEKSRHTAGGVSSMSDQTETDLLRAMASAPNRATQHRLAAQLEAHRASALAKARQEKALDFGAMYADRAPLISEAAYRHTADTDWMNEAEPTHDLNLVTQAMVAYASVWYSGRTAAVKADLDELAAQAAGYSARVASQFGADAPAAQKAFLDHVEHLHSRTANDYGSSGGSGSSLPPVNNEETFDENLWPQSGGHADGSKPGDTPSMGEGGTPEGDSKATNTNPEADSPSHDGGPGFGVHPTKDFLGDEVPAPEWGPEWEKTFPIINEFTSAYKFAEDDPSKRIPYRPYEVEHDHDDKSMDLHDSDANGDWDWSGLSNSIDHPDLMLRHERQPSNFLGSKTAEFPPPKKKDPDDDKDKDKDKKPPAKGENPFAKKPDGGAPPAAPAPPAAAAPPAAPPAAPGAAPAPVAPAPAPAAAPGSSPSTDYNAGYADGKTGKPKDSTKNSSDYGEGYAKGKGEAGGGAPAPAMPAKSSSYNGYESQDAFHDALQKEWKERLSTPEGRAEHERDYGPKVVNHARCDHAYDYCAMSPDGHFTPSKESVRNPRLQAFRARVQANMHQAR